MAIFLPFGIVIVATTDNYDYFKVRYDDKCTQLNTTCTFNFTVSKTLHGPVYFYYGLTHFHQNHRKYYKWRSHDQLYNGKQYTKLSTAKGDCGDRTTNREMGWNTSVTGASLNPDDIAYPCGFISYSFFNGRFKLTKIPIPFLV